MEHKWNNEMKDQKSKITKSLFLSSAGTLALFSSSSCKLQVTFSVSFSISPLSGNTLFTVNYAHIFLLIFLILSFLLLMPAASHNCGHVFTHCYFSVFLNLICSDLIISVFFMLFFFIKMTRQFLETKPHAVLIQTNLNKKHKQHWQCRKTEAKKLFFVLLTLSSKYWPTDVRKN